MSEPMQCEKCSYSTFYQVHFRKHYKKMHTGKPKEKQYLCEKCEKTYTYEYELRNHIKVKHQGFRFNCEYCQKTYSNIQVLNHHLRKSHSDEVKDKMKEMSFLCDLCSKVLQYRLWSF